MRLYIAFGMLHAFSAFAFAADVPARSTNKANVVTVSGSPISSELANYISASANKINARNSPEASFTHAFGDVDVRADLIDWYTQYFNALEYRRVLIETYNEFLHTNELARDRVFKLRACFIYTKQDLELNSKNLPPQMLRMHMGEYVSVRTNVDARDIITQLPTLPLVVVLGDGKDSEANLRLFDTAVDEWIAANKRLTKNRLLLGSFAINKEIASTLVDHSFRFGADSEWIKTGISNYIALLGSTRLMNQIDVSAAYELYYPPGGADAFINQITPTKWLSTSITADRATIQVQLHYTRDAMLTFLQAAQHLGVDKIQGYLADIQRQSGKVPITTASALNMFERTFAQPLSRFSPYGHIKAGKSK